MQSSYQHNINNALKELHDTKNISSALLVCNTLLEYMGIETKSVEDIELSKLKLPNAERYDRWFDNHPHFRGDRACFDIAPQASLLEAKFFALQKRSKLFIAGAVSFTPNFEDRDYTRNDPDMKVGIDFFLTPEKDSIIVVLSNKGNLRLVELTGRLTNTQIDIFSLWHNVAEIADKNIFHATLWESFKLSSLNKKFYEGIANSFLSLTQHLQDNKVEEQLSNQFANRLHGRLLFLWFLRKKNIIDESRQYFAIEGQNDTDYYHEKLAYLFFDVLNTDIIDRDKVQKEKNTLFGKEKGDQGLFAVDSTTPYLNGGLFDQNSDGEYWNTNKPTFPAGFFRALYDHFDSFNFTTDESTPEYEQIAIDPEMLGRIFESFLATLTTETGAQAKKANGAFYTPREIVSYMSRESLRQYLYTVLDAGTTLKTSIDDLLDRPDSEWALAGTNSKRDTVAKEDRERILEALRNIKILDPAVGSGAFPMGVLHKILSLFERLEPNFDSYETKLSILKNNIYGVDIDPTAIEISRLRAWLSIIVDVKDIKKIKPLPNLDFKFVCANSLISLNTTTDNLFEDVENNVINQLRDLFEKYYGESRKKAKEKLKTDIETVLQHSKVFLQAGSSFKEKLDTYKPFSTNNKAEFYSPKLMHGIDSFDVIIGNPPYIRHRDLPKKYKEELRNSFTTGNTTSDIYCYFYELGYGLLSTRGVLLFITSNKWMRSRYGQNLRILFKNKTTLLEIIDLGGGQFETATVDTNILIFRKEIPPIDHVINCGRTINDLSIKLMQSDLSDNAFALVDQDILDIKKKIEIKGSKLKKWKDIKINYGILTGRNDTKNDSGEKEGVFIIDEEKKNELIKKNENSRLLIKPILRGKDIFKYGYKWQKKYLIAVHFGLHKDIDNFPAIKEHLSKYKEILETRAQVIRGDHHWIELDQNPSERYMEELSSNKIIYPNIHKEFAVAYEDEGFLINQKCFCITGKNLKYLVGILNSKLNFFYFKLIGASLGNAGYEISKIFVNELPIPTPDVNLLIADKIEKLVEQILSIKKADSKADTKDLENQIDTLVYKLYDLNDEEIKVIEGQK